MVVIQKTQCIVNDLDNYLKINIPILSELETNLNRLVLLFHEIMRAHMN